MRKRLSSSYKRRLGEAHARGMVKDSPFISTLEDINKGANTTDPWLRKIITGEDIGLEQIGEVKKNLTKMRKLGRKGKLEDAALIARTICRQIGSEKQKGMKEYWQDELASVLVGFMKFTDFSSY